MAKHKIAFGLLVVAVVALAATPALAVPFTYVTPLPVPQSTLWTTNPGNGRPWSTPTSDVLEATNTDSFFVRNGEGGGETNSILFHLPPEVGTGGTVIANQAAYGFPTALIEQTGATAGQISDVFGVAFDPTSQHYVLGFLTDDDIATNPGAIALYFGVDPTTYFTASNTVAESPGVAWDASQYLNPVLRGESHPWTASFQSDYDVVPEPATMVIWSLLGGFGAIAGWRRRRKAV